MPNNLERAARAFTLRLDAERHLRLRLACAVTGRSAQRLVVEALDKFLADIPAVGAALTTILNEEDSDAPPDKAGGK